MRDEAIAKINAEMQKNPNDLYTEIIGQYIIDRCSDEAVAAKAAAPRKSLAGAMQAGLMVAKYFRTLNFEGRGKEDADEWMADVTLACTALRYVAEFAADKCCMILIPNPRPGKEKENGGSPE